MTSIRMMALAAAVLGFNAEAASKHDYTYTPSPGVHEVKYFHGCWDNKDDDKRPKIDVTMAGLNTGDVQVQTRPREEGKPSTEMITFRLKTMDASFSVQFRSKDGDHCQQGVANIAFRNAVLRNENDVDAIR
jgi:hypothetical protein